jgi:hypothetical protein
LKFEQKSSDFSHRFALFLRLREVPKDPTEESSPGGF